MARKNSTLLLVIFFLSVSIIPMIEMGHDILHSFKNPFHNHDGGHKAYIAHTVGDHYGFQKMKFTHQMEDNQPINNLIWFAYQFSRSLETFAISPDYTISADHHTPVTESAYVVYVSPLTRPPLSIGLI